MHLSTVLILSLIFTNVWGLPPKGCASCMLAPSEPLHKNLGEYFVEKLLGNDGCFIQRVSCKGKSENAETFIQFNYGQSGFFAVGKQIIDINCNKHGEWVINKLGATLTVQSVACLST